MGGFLKRFLVVLFSAMAISSLVPASYCLKKPVTAARKEDIPFVICQVCEKVASELYRQVQKKQFQISPKKVSEFEIIGIAENVCNLKKEEADWILKIDIVEKGDKLELEEQDAEGHCNSECKTIEKACEEVMGSSDTDVAEYIYKNKPDIESLVKYLCNEQTTACNKKPPPVPKDRAPGEPFVAKPTKEADMERMLRSMQDMPGAPNMKMYSREQLMNNNFGNEDEDDEEDADEDEDEDGSQFTSKLGKLLKEKQKGAKADWKDKVTEGIVNAGEMIRTRTNSISNRLRRWWSGSRSSKTSNNNKAEL